MFRRILGAFCVGKDLRIQQPLGWKDHEGLVFRRSLGAAVFWRVHESCPIGKDLRDCCVDKDLRGFCIGKYSEGCHVRGILRGCYVERNLGGLAC